MLYRDKATARVKESWFCREGSTEKVLQRTFHREGFTEKVLQRGFYREISAKRVLYKGMYRVGGSTESYYTEGSTAALQRWFHRGSTKRVI